MSKGRDFRQPRRRGFDDDMPQPYDTRGPAPRPASRPFGGPSSFDQSPAAGPVVDATVKWFNPEKGFGFTELADGSGDAFLHIGTLQASGHDSVAPGAKLRVQADPAERVRRATAPTCRPRSRWSVRLSGTMATRVSASSRARTAARTSS